MTMLLATKLRQPHPLLRRVQRPLLRQRLHAGLQPGRQLTLVSAPAGYGKTTCISEWVSTLQGWPVAWLSLDPADDDPARFVAYLLAALQKVDESLGRELQGVLRAGQLPPSDVISATLVNDILELEGRFLLVLDDLQVIQDPFILRLLEELVTSLPQPLHLVLLTREDPPLPLARLRANNRLTEIRARDLRFSEPEASLFLNELMGLSLPAGDVTVLAAKTEGWVAGLQLAGLSIQGRADPSGYIAALSGSHRFILSYLTEEVLDRQPEEMQQFLLETSILSRLNGELCDAVTGRSDSRALLERLLSANLFLTPLDDDGQWYRYHHLFADLLRDLRQTLQKDATAELHRRASHWYAQAGMPGEAIEHALAAADYASAVSLLESHATEMVMHGYAKTVHGWVEAIPREWGVRSPKTSLAFAWMHLLRGAYAQAAPYLEQAQAAIAGFQAAPHPGEEESSLEAEWLVVRSLALYMQGKPAESRAVATRALEIAPEQDGRVRSLAYYALAGACQVLEDDPQAIEAYRMAIRHGRAADSPVAEMLATAGLGLIAFWYGQLHLAFEISAPLIARLERSGSLPPASAIVYGLLGEVCYQWHQVEEGQRHALRALQLSRLGGYNTGTVLCRVLLSRLAQLAGDLEAADREVRQALDLLPLEVPDYVRQEVVSQQARVYLARNRPAAAQMALQAQGFSYGDRFSYPDLPAARSVSYSLGLLYNSSLHVLLHQARAVCDPAGLKQGVELAGRLIAAALQGPCLPVALEALLLRAQMQEMLGDQPAGRADYIRALELAEPEGFIGVFVEQGQSVAEALAPLVRQKQPAAAQAEHIARILAAFTALQSPGTGRAEQASADRLVESELAALIEPLTEREVDVLRAMAEGLKYREIAARLFITLNTVRFHVKAIYGKLGANNRTQAIEAARQLGML